MREELKPFQKPGSPEQYAFIYALMDVTGCRKHIGVGWIWRLVNASPEEIAKATRIANERERNGRS
jgi:hypothetical protein